MANQTIETEILSVYGLKKRGRGESDQAYFERLVSKALSGEGPSADADWEKLSTDAQNWINDGGKAIEAKKDIAGFPDANGAADEDEGEKRPPRKAAAKANGKAPAAAKGKAKAEEKTDEKPKAKATAAAADKSKPKATAAAKAKATEKKPKKAEGVYASTQRYVVNHPHAKTEEIMEALRKKGLEPAQHTVQSVRGHTRDTLKLVQEIYGNEFGF